MDEGKYELDPNDGDIEGICTNCWPPCGFETVQEYVTYMTETGLWGSKEYFVWKQRKIRHENLCKRQLVSSEDYPKDFPEVFYPGWMDDWGQKYEYGGVIQVGEFAKVATALAEKMTTIPYKEPIFVLNYRARKGHPPVLHMPDCPSARKSKEWKEIFTVEEWKEYKEKYTYYRCERCESYKEDEKIR